MAEREVSQIQKTVFDLDSFEEVKLVKVPPKMAEVASIDEFLARVGNDSAKALKIINDGLEDAYRKEFAEDPNQPWHTFGDEDEVNGEFSGTIAEPKAVNSLVLTLAKTVFGFSKDMTKEQKKAAKASAVEMIKGNEAIKDGLRKSAAKKTASA